MVPKREATTPLYLYTGKDQEVEVVVTVLLKLDCIFTLKEEQKAALKTFFV